MSPYTWRVWHGLSQKGRCRYCGKVILWVTTDANKHVPLDVDAQPLRTETAVDSGARFDVFVREALHTITCARRRTRVDRL